MCRCLGYNEEQRKKIVFLVENSNHAISFRFSNIVCFWLILKIEKVLKNEKVFIYLQV